MALENLVLLCWVPVWQLVWHLLNLGSSGLNGKSVFDLLPRKAGMEIDNIELHMKSLPAQIVSMATCHHL